MTPPPYLFLGGFRVALALCVFIAHADASAGWAATITWGGLGVWLFYTVSGYVIVSAHETFYRGKVGAFAVNRALRIYPLLWVCLGLACLQVWTAGGVELDHWGLRQLLLALSVIGGFADDRAWAPLPPAATLSIEALFYVASALTMAVAERAGRRRGLVLYLIGLGCLGAYVLVEMTHSHYRFFGGLRWSPLFLLGAMMFYAQRARFRAAETVLLVLALVACVHLLLSLGSPSAWAGFALEPVRLRTLTLFLVLAAAMLALVHLRVPARLHGADILAGDLTYPLYLVHVPVILALDHALGWAGWAGFGLQLVASLAAALVLHRLVEAPFAMLRRRWRGAAL